MPNFTQSLQDHDLGHLRIIADLWRVEAELPDARKGRRNLANALLNADLTAEIVDALPEDARLALGVLRRNGHRLVWTQFIRQFGEVREMGPAKRDRELPHLNPISTNEILYYRGLVGRAYFNGTHGSPQEYAYVPEDMIPLLPPLQEQPHPLQTGRPATPDERKHKVPTTDAILDHACILLAALRMGKNKAEIEHISQHWPIPVETLVQLLQAAKILDKNQQLNKKATRNFLEEKRGQSFLKLFNAWYAFDFNDLMAVPDLEKEGVWKNNPAQTRKTILALLGEVDTKTWQHIDAWIDYVKQQNPDFQRSGGEYDAWYLRNSHTGEYLRGETHWMHVEGALLRFLITGPLHWLGILDLAAPEAGQRPTAFRFSIWAKKMLVDQTAPALQKENEKFLINNRLEITSPPLTPRDVHYQVARFTEWEGKRKDGYRYQITPEGLSQAKEQGLKIPQFITLLEKNSNPTPPNLKQTLTRWEQNGTQARIEPVMVLRVTHPDILEQVKNSRAARFLGIPLGPTAITVAPGAWESVQNILAELGVLTEIKKDEL